MRRGGGSTPTASASNGAAPFAPAQVPAPQQAQQAAGLSAFDAFDALASTRS